MNKSPKGIEFIKNLIGFSSAAWISAIISFGSTPIITRLFLPEEIGKVNLFITFLNFFQILSIFGLDQAYMRFYNEKQNGLNKKNLFSFCLKINFIMSVIYSIGILFFSNCVSSNITGQNNIQVTILLVIAVISSTILRMCSIYSRMENNIKLYIFQSVSITIIEKVLIICSYAIGAKYFNAILLISLGYLLVATIMIMINRNSIFISTKNVPKETVKAIFKFSVPYLPVLLLSWLNNSIPQLFLKQFLDYSAIGIYSNAVTIANILTILQTGFTTYWNPFSYENYKTNGEKLKKVHKIITFLIIMLALCVVLGQDIIYLLLGDAYRESKKFFAFLLFTPVCNTIADTTGVGIVLSKKSYLNIITFICNTLVNVIICIALIPVIGIAGAAIAAGTSAIVMLIVRTLFGNKYYKINDRYNYIIISIISLYVVALWNLYSPVNYLKYIVASIFIIVNLFVYRKEIKYLYKYLISIMKSYSERKKIV